jgi:Family of unknown function (DUF6221)
MSDDLVTWLRATIEGDKQAALIISSGGFAPERWDTDPPGQVNPARMAQAVQIDALLTGDDEDDEDDPLFRPDGYWVALYSYERENNEPESARVREGYLPVVIVNDGRREADHIRRHDPRSIVARCEAELAILDEHAQVPAGYRGEGILAGEYGCRVCHCHEQGTDPEGACHTVRLLGAGYRHRAGYRVEWLPESD